MLFSYCSGYGSTFNNVLQLAGIFIVFVLILIAMYYTTRFIGKSGLVQGQSKNISVIETFKIAPNKYIQIIKLGTKYCAIAVAKEQITFLTDLDEEQLVFSENTPLKNVSFKEIISKTLKSKEKNS